jgi:DNA-binding response OmpR family regulator
MTVSCEERATSRLQEHSMNRRDDMQWDAKRRTVTIGEKTVALTPLQYRLLFSLREGVAVSYIDLAQMVYHCAFDEKVRMMMDKQVDRMRRKLKGTGIYVYCVLGYGYLLLDEISPEERK